MTAWRADDPTRETRAVPRTAGDAVSHDFRERRFTAQDGLSLYYRDYGDALLPRTPVLCLSGLARHSADFHRTALRLCGERRVICPDYRGRGRSDHDPDPMKYQAHTYVNDIAHLLAVAGVHRVVVIGTSLGGLLAAAMGAAMPRAVAGVVMNDIGPELEDGGTDRIFDYIGRDHPQPDWESAHVEIRRMFPDMGFRTEEDWRECAEGTWRMGEDGRLHFAWDPNIVVPLRRGAPLPDLWALFRSLRELPVLAIRGARSDVLSAATFARMAEMHPGLEQLTVEGLAHAPSLSEPECVAAIDRFLARF
jgi:pimeloyl-ACP methyl ester carboxylesterase